MLAKREQARRKQNFGGMTIALDRCRFSKNWRTQVGERSEKGFTDGASEDLTGPVK
jgi:hypothetical protein